MTTLWQWLVGARGVHRVDEVQLRFASAWAAEYPILIALLFVAGAALSLGFYRHFQPVPRAWQRAVLIGLRAAVIAFVVVLFARPVLALTGYERERPVMLVLVDHSGSMQLPDARGSEAVSRLARAYAALGAGDRPVLEQMGERYRVRAYTLERGDRVSEADPAALSADDDPHEASGQVTALGVAIDDLTRRHEASRVAGLVMLSDFAHNSGPDPTAAARRLGAPIYAVGVGPVSVLDTAIDLRTPPLLKVGEDATLAVDIRQSGADGREVTVRLFARLLGSIAGGLGEPELRPIGPPQRVVLDGPDASVTLPFTPLRTGRYVLEARLTPLDGEALVVNNTASRQAIVRDRSLRVMCVEHEPTWNWRAIREVMRGDPLVGDAGLRTYLRSASLEARRRGEEFLPSLLPPRSQFFSQDAIVLGDVPPDMLTARFHSAVEAWVREFGGGLIVVAGPRFGLAGLSGTTLGRMLPVTVNRDTSPAGRPLSVRLSPSAADAGFMSLGADPGETDRAWSRLDRVPWHQPLAGVHPDAVVLAEHPGETTGDGRPLPVIAVRRYGRGEVIYIGTSETWRLRRHAGDEYYRRLWAGMIYRLGLGRALGEQKRFVVRTDRPQYRGGDTVQLVVEAYDAEFRPLEAPVLDATLLPPAGFGAGGGASPSMELSLPVAADGVIYRTAFPVYAAGTHRVLVRDPVTGDHAEVEFDVSAVSAEQRAATRDASLQHTLAAVTGGRAIEPDELPGLLDTIEPYVFEEPVERRVPLWNAPVALLLGAVLLFGEWLFRKWCNLR